MAMPTPRTRPCDPGMAMEHGERSVYFHIGLHKTATKWFQRRLFPAIDGLDLIETDDIAEAAARIATTRARRVIVSHERMSGMIRDSLPPGTGTARLADSLAAISRHDPKAGIIIGFREHGDWINSAFAQRAKKHGLSPRSYLAGFSQEDLSWCGKLDRIEATFTRVFPFLYEELALDPLGLVADICRFIDAPAPSRLEAMLQVRENRSPRSRIGQLLAQPFHRSANWLGRLPGFSVAGVQDFGAQLGARFDRLFPYLPPAVVFGPTQQAILAEDWAALLLRVEAQRGRRIVAFPV